MNSLFKRFSASHTLVWKTVVGLSVHRGFESLPLRFSRRDSSRRAKSVSVPLPQGAFRRALGGVLGERKRRSLAFADVC